MTKLVLSLHSERTTWPLRLMLAVMVGVAGLALIAQWALVLLAQSWDSGLRGSLTVELPAETKIETALNDIRATTGVAAARAVDEGTTAALLAPWFGDDMDLIRQLSLPRLIDVTPAAGIAQNELADRLRRALPEAGVDDHAGWIKHWAALARKLAWVAGAVAFGLLAAVMLAVTFACRSGLTALRPIIELLHIMGAPEGAIARQMQLYATRLAGPGSLMGMGFALLVALALASAAMQLAVTPPRLFWIGLGVLAVTVPLFAIATAWIAAGAAARRALRSWP